MKMLTFDPKAWKDYIEWSLHDIKTFKKINDLIKDISRHPYSGSGLGKPEQLKHEFSKYWSRRINLNDRLVYKINDDQILIAKCKGHYTK